MKLKTALVALALSLAGAAWADPATGWLETDPVALQGNDEDVARHARQPGFFAGLAVSTRRFSENGFAWELIRWSNPAKPNGPLWVVPHDDEDGAFDAMIDALKTYGGVGIAVNTSGARRMQTGHGHCGVRTGSAFGCDPNRNFASSSPIYVAAFLDQRPAGQPVIALHTNRPGFSGDRQRGGGDFSVLDAVAYRHGSIAPRPWALLAVSPTAEMANYDTFGLSPFLSRNGRPDEASQRCGTALSTMGISFWHEPVRQSDGSLSNYIALTRPDIGYFNAESRSEADPAVSAARHALIIAGYLKKCLQNSAPAMLAKANSHPR